MTIKKNNKNRLDACLSELYPQYSKTQLQSWIMQGEVFVNDHKVTKPGTPVDIASCIRLRAEPPRYVSRAGVKLEHALDYFNIDVTGMVVLDAGLSTGGFADCLLQKGAKKIYGIDVGHGQVHEKLQHDERLLSLEKTNLRTYIHQGDSIDCVTLDLSFISLLKVMDTVKSLLSSGGYCITLIKPQFEADVGQVPKGGVIIDTLLHQTIVNSVVEKISTHGFDCKGVIDSPILGTAGNKEFLACFVRI